MQVSLQSSTKKIKTQMYDIKLLNIYFISTNFFCDPINLINNLIIVTVIVILLFSVCFLVVSFFCDFRFFKMRRSVENHVGGKKAKAEDVMSAALREQRIENATICVDSKGNAFTLSLSLSPPPLLLLLFHTSFFARCY